MGDQSMRQATSTSFVDLPIELTEHIFEFLPLYQRIILLQVCRALSHPCFWRIAYRAVSLYNVHQLNNFTYTVERANDCYSEINLGECVRHLTLWKNLLGNGINANLLLQKHCPFVECVEITKGLDYCPQVPFECWQDLTVMSTSLFDCWPQVLCRSQQRITHLAVDTSLGIDFSMPWSFPHLTHLDYRPSGFIHTLEKLNGINRACPVLQYLHMGYLDAQQDYDDLIKTMDPPVTPLTCLTHLDLVDVYFSDPAMYQIFGVLYPNLVSLKIQHMRDKPRPAQIRVDNDGNILEPYSDEEDDDDGDDFGTNALSQQQYIQDNQQHHTWATTAEALNQMTVKLPRLRQLHLPSIGVSPSSGEWSPGDLWLHHCARLEDIRLDWYCKNLKSSNGLTDKRPEPKWERVTHLLALCQDTIRSWHLFLKHDPLSSQRAVFNVLAQCPWLHSLTIHTTYESDATVPIDELLTFLPHLKSLEFQTKYGKDLLSPVEKMAPRLRSLGPSTTIVPHGLTRFVYIGKLYSSRLIAYVHARCPSISVLHLDGRQTPSKKVVTLSLTGWRLQELDIGSVFDVGKMVKTVLVQEMSYSPPLSRLFQFSRGAWYRKPCGSHPSEANLKIVCDYIERCVYKPQDPFFIHTHQY
ncbi:hypothetical protein BCR42DRAFT_399611 [Absidia repens]|uniref:F-box domain-containing protein n=1 Tax=Absidia repens TaxID=90262 RepID=A0A1X2J090_9FUNG|nr:hypothetical protein BCR42DRAFT_399611 [Absidia repens]